MWAAYGRPHSCGPRPQESWIKMRVGGLKAARILDKWVDGRLVKVSLGKKHDVYMIICSVDGWRTLILIETQDFAQNLR